MESQRADLMVASTAVQTDVRSAEQKGSQSVKQTAGHLVAMKAFETVAMRDELMAYQWEYLLDA